MKNEKILEIMKFILKASYQLSRRKNFRSITYEELKKLSTIDKLAFSMILKCTKNGLNQNIVQKAFKEKKE